MEPSLIPYNIFFLSVVRSHQQVTNQLQQQPQQSMDNLTDTDITSHARRYGSLDPRLNEVFYRLFLLVEFCFNLLPNKHAYTTTWVGVDVFSFLPLIPTPIQRHMEKINTVIHCFIAV
jgi:hypothetical protein